MPLLEPWSPLLEPLGVPLDPGYSVLGGLGPLLEPIGVEWPLVPVEPLPSEGMEPLIFPAFDVNGLSIERQRERFLWAVNARLYDFTLLRVSINRTFGLRSGVVFVIPFIEFSLIAF